MARQGRIVILGGHGKVALLAAPRLIAASYTVDSVIRKPDQSGDVERTGAHPVVLDIEGASVDDLAELFSGAAAVVFSAGAGGGDPVRTRAVDYEAATRAMQAALQSGATRFVMVSYAGAEADRRRVDPDDPFYPYVLAKSDADAYLRQTALEYTILGPGSLTLEPASGTIRVVDRLGEDNEGRERIADDAKITSRENVAAVIAHVITENAALRQTVDFYDGATPIADAIR